MTATLQRDVLNLGSGHSVMPNAINIDCVRSTNPDLLHDLNQFPWPLPSNEFREIHAYDVIEHLEDVVRVVNELHRVAAPGAAIHITVPHFSCSNAFADPTHRHYFSVRSFDYFTELSRYAYYSEARFRLATKQIVFKDSILDRAVSQLARHWPEHYEARWAWMFPAWFLYFKLIVIK